jgi:hypothetical protein
LEVHHNIYGAKQGGKVWNKYLVKKLTSIGFQQLVTNDCIFFKGCCMYVLYTDDSILTKPDPEELDDIIHQIRQSGLKITTEDEKINDFLGVLTNTSTINKSLAKQTTLKSVLILTSHMLCTSVHASPLICNSNTDKWLHGSEGIFMAHMTRA